MAAAGIRARPYRLLPLRVQPRDDARDIAVDRRGRGVERDRGDRRRRIGADARQRAQRGFVTGKPAAPRGDHFCAGMQIARAGVVAEAGEGLHDRFQRRGGQHVDVGPARDEVLEVGRRASGRGLLQQDFRQPDAVGIGARARRRAPG